jgi:SagB-type dehydrogenase family enzyme
VKRLPVILLLAAPLAGAHAQAAAVVRLPPPRTTGSESLYAALATRRSVRQFTSRPVALADLGQILWAAQGVTSPRGGRTAPSAGARYPLELFVVASNVSDLAPGVYRYRPASHDLARTAEGDHRPALAEAVGQGSIEQAPVVVVFSGVYQRTTQRYGDRGTRFVHIEVGLAAENACLAVVAAGLGSVTVGAFRDDQVTRVLGLASDDQPLLLLPVGWPRSPE